MQTVDNMSGPTAIANLHTLINEQINGFVDFQVLAAYQPAMAKVLKSAKIPAVTVVGATLPGFPQVGLDPFHTEEQGAIYMAQQAKKRFPGQVPYFLGGAEPASGAAVFARYQGAVAGVKTVYPGIPKSHIIEVITNGLAPTAYSNTLSALSAVPKNGVVMVQAVNDEDTGGMFKAVQARRLHELSRRGLRWRLVRAEAGVPLPDTLCGFVVPQPRGLGPGAPLPRDDANERPESTGRNEHRRPRGNSLEPDRPLQLVTFLISGPRLR